MKARAAQRGFRDKGLDFGASGVLRFSGSRVDEPPSDLKAALIHILDDKSYK